MIKRLQNVYVTATDVERAVRFYRDALGLPLKFRDGQRWAQFDLSNASFAVSAPGEGAATAGAGAVVVLEVESLEGALAALRSRGVAVEGEIVDMGAHGRYVTLRDPTGNPLQLFQRASP